MYFCNYYCHLGRFLICGSWWSKFLYFSKKKFENEKWKKLNFFLLDLPGRPRQLIPLWQQKKKPFQSLKTPQHENSSDDDENDPKPKSKRNSEEKILKQKLDRISVKENVQRSSAARKEHQPEIMLNVQAEEERRKSSKIGMNRRLSREFYALRHCRYLRKNGKRRSSEESYWNHWIIAMADILIQGGSGLMYVWVSGHLGIWASGHPGI